MDGVLAGRYNKFLVAIATVAVALVTANIDTTVTHWASIVVGVLGSLGVFAIPNTPPEPSEEPA